MEKRVFLAIFLSMMVIVFWSAVVPHPSRNSLQPIDNKVVTPKEHADRVNSVPFESQSSSPLSAPAATNFPEEILT